MFHERGGHRTATHRLQCRGNTDRWRAPLSPEFVQEPCSLPSPPIPWHCYSVSVAFHWGRNPSPEKAYLLAGQNLRPSQYVGERAARWYGPLAETSHYLHLSGVSVIS